MKSIAVLTSPEVPLPAEGCALLDTLPCTTTVCTPGNAAEVVGASEACFVWDTDLTSYIESQWDAFAHLSWMHVAVTGVDLTFVLMIWIAITCTIGCGERQSESSVCL